MLIAIHGVIGLIAIQGVKLNAHTFTWTEALCSLPYIK